MGTAVRRDGVNTLADRAVCTRAAPHSLERARWVLLFVLAGTLAVVTGATSCVGAEKRAHSADVRPTVRDLRLPTYAGIDYAPSTKGMRGPCLRYWTYLKPRCWSGGMRARIVSDVSFIAKNRLGKFHRLWLSLDQLFGCWRERTGYCGYNRRALANVDDLLRIFVRAGFRLDLILFQPEHTNRFHVEALDGNHRQMRANYIKAVVDFLRHVARDRVAARAVAVVDFQNEVYFQNEAHLAGRVTWNGGPCDETCLDENVILPWVQDLYRAAKKAAPRFLYTASDTKRLMEDPAAWVRRYPVDVYDIHFYKDDPWNYADQYAASSRYFRKPWFAGEVGCAPGNYLCTYDGNAAMTLKIDMWWLANLRSYGAQAVLVENSETVFQVGNPYRLTAVGRAIARENRVRRKRTR